MVYDRFVIIGKPGAGKTTLSNELSQILGVKAVELDAIHWQPNWGVPDTADFHAWVDDALPADGRWAADGNYKVVRDIVWARATTAIWLDYPLWLTLWRLLCRTLGRWFWAKELWNGNRETLLKHFKWDWDENLFMWAVKVHSTQREEFPRVLREEYGHLRVLRFRHPRELEEWLGSLKTTEGDSVPLI